MSSSSSAAVGSSVCGRSSRMKRLAICATTAVHAMGECSREQQRATQRTGEAHTQAHTGTHTHTHARARRDLRSGFIPTCAVSARSRSPSTRSFNSLRRSMLWRAYSTRRFKNWWDRHTAVAVAQPRRESKGKAGKRPQ